MVRSMTTADTNATAHTNQPPPTNKALLAAIPDQARVATHRR